MYLIVSLFAALSLWPLAATAEPMKFHRDSPHRWNSSDVIHCREGARKGSSHQHPSPGGSAAMDCNSNCDEQCHERIWLDGDQRMLDEP
jgi:hypothetical protein